MHELHAKARLLERAANVVHALLGATKHQHALNALSLLGASGAYEFLEQLGLLALRDGAEVFLNGIGRLAYARNLYAKGVMEHGVDS
jgi:hypothetical protein